MNILYYIVSSLLKAYFTLFHRLKVYGLENLPKGAAILAPNHTSFYDPPIMSASCNEEIHFLARASLFEPFLFGSFISKLNAHPVTGTAQDLTSMKLISKLLKEQKKVVIFPEGNRSEDGELGSIKSGVSMLSIRTHAPIIPVYIEGAFQAWDRSNKFPRPWGKITCTFGKPIYPQDFAQYGKKEAQEKMAASLEYELAALKEKRL